MKTIPLDEMAFAIFCAACDGGYTEEEMRGFWNAREEWERDEWRAGARAAVFLVVTRTGVDIRLEES
jgi:hypothetical protein